MSTTWLPLVSGLLALLLAACGQAVPEPAALGGAPAATVVVLSASPEPTRAATPSELPLPAATPRATHTVIPPTSLPPAATPSATATATAALPDLSLDASGVFIYPVSTIFAGDTATFQVMARVPELISPNDVAVRIWVDDQLIVDSNLGWRNLAGDAIGLYAWAWNTAGQEGLHTLTVALDPDDRLQIGDENPDNNQVRQTFAVTAVEAMPAADAQATWIMVNSTCCRVYVVRGTAAERDLDQLVALTDEAVALASERLQVTPESRLNAILINRVIGQGGYAAGPSMVVSYLDRQYAGTSVEEVLLHEAVHALDTQFAPHRIPFLAEGVAVWATGGHYKQEAIHERAAVLLQMDGMVRLPELIDDFYRHQHEMGYLEAASFVKFLVDKYGWPQVRAFYADVDAEDAATLSEAVDVNLKNRFQRSLDSLEEEWLASLESLEPERGQRDDLVTTVRYYDTMRQYQQVYDPTAHFLTAWLPAPQTVLDRDDTVDLGRHPDQEINVVLETMLQAAGGAMSAGNYLRANVILDSVERVLKHNGDFLDPLATNFRQIVRLLTGLGYEVQRIDLEGNQATVLTTRANTTVLVQLELTLAGESWTLSQ